MSLWRKNPHACANGPWQGERLYLDATSDGATGWIIVGGIVGRYFRGRFQPAPQQPKKGDNAP